MLGTTISTILDTIAISIILYSIIGKAVSEFRSYNLQKTAEPEKIGLLQLPKELSCLTSSFLTFNDCVSLAYTNKKFYYLPIIYYRKQGVAKLDDFHLYFLHKVLTVWPVEFKPHIQGIRSISVPVSLRLLLQGKSDDEIKFKSLIDTDYIGKHTEHLDFSANTISSPMSYINDNHITTITAKCPNLTSLIVKNSQQISDTAITALAQKCKKLKLLTISYCRQITNQSILEIAENCKDIEEIDIENCKNITNKSITKLAQKCKKLNKISLAWCGKITDLSIREIIENNLELKYINMYKTETSRQITKSLVQKFAQIKIINKKGKCIQAKNINDVSDDGYSTSSS